MVDGFKNFMMKVANSIKADLTGKENNLVLVVEQAQYKYPNKNATIEVPPFIPHPETFVKNTYHLGEIPYFVDVKIENNNSISIGSVYNSYLVSEGKLGKWKLRNNHIILSDIFSLTNYGVELPGSDSSLPPDRNEPFPCGKSVFIIAGDDKVKEYAKEKLLKVKTPFFELLKDYR